MIFTGNKGRKPDRISLSKEFFEGADIDVEVKAKVIYAASVLYHLTSYPPDFQKSVAKDAI